MRSHRSKYGMPFERVAIATLLASAAAVFMAAGSGVQISLLDRTPAPHQVAFFDRGSEPVPIAPLVALVPPEVFAPPASALPPAVAAPEIIQLTRELPDPRPRTASSPEAVEPRDLPRSPRVERLASVVDHGTGTVLAAALSGGGLLAGRQAPPRNDASIIRGVAVPVSLPTPPLANIRDTESMTRRFDQMGYRLEGVREGDDVPHLFLASLPRDLPKVDSVDERKRLFITALLPHILRVNETVLEERARLQRLAQRQADGHAIALQEQSWLEALAERYGESVDDFNALLRRHDIVPPSLALAQSIEESGWGTSRFALHGNALFGQHTFSVGGGMVPERRATGERYEVKSFDHLHESVLTYVMNLNRHAAYKEFRRVREAMRGKDAPLNGVMLAGSLTRYSERGQEYVDTIRSIMRSNDLAAFDGAKLQDPRTYRIARGF